jgi:hypothetical protein
MRWVVVLAVVAALAAPAAGASSAAGGGAERIPVGCVTEYSPETGEWFGRIDTPDTPLFLPIGPDSGPFFAFGGGTAVFTSSGNMEVNCHGEADLTRGPPFSGHGHCVAARGGDEFGNGSRSYLGEGELIVTPSANVTISCHGGFTGIFS